MFSHVFPLKTGHFPVRYQLYRAKIRFQPIMLIPMAASFINPILKWNTPIAQHGPNVEIPKKHPWFRAKGVFNMNGGMCFFKNYFFIFPQKSWFFDMFVTCMLRIAKSPYVVCFLTKNQVPEISYIQLVAASGVLAPELGDAHGHLSG